MASRGFVYFLGSSIGFTKIGHTQHVASRVKNIQSGLASDPRPPIKTWLIGYMRGGRTVEQWFHGQLREFRHHGEWFESNAVQIMIERLDIITPGSARDSGCATEARQERQTETRRVDAVIARRGLADQHDEAVASAMTASEGNVSEAARRLGIHRRSLQRKLRRGKTEQARPLSSDQAAPGEQPDLFPDP